MHVVLVDGSPLTIEQVVAVAKGHVEVDVGGDLDARMAPARRLVEQVLEDRATVYGITTGFGALASTHIEPEAAARLQIGLVRSHAAGVGPELPAELIRAMLLLRARTLAQGHSGVRPEIVRRLITMLQLDLLPVVPSQGSVGASGDLAPFAHLALPVIGEGEVRFAGRRMAAAEGLAAVGLQPVVLQAKEGLSLLNGTEGMLAMGVLAVDRALRLADAADLACALSVEALLGSARPFDARIHQLRPHPGQLESARRIASMLAGSEIVASHSDDFVHAVQDAYSLRCAPQVHGAARDVIAFAKATFDRELGSVVDNPIVFASLDGTGAGDVVSGGNFHGQPLAFALDFMAVAVTELGSISERRTDRILSPDRSSGLPAFLATEPGVNSGFMLSQYTAAALVAENRVMSHPASVESIPTSGLQEDHVSMGWGAGRKLGQVLDNTARVLAVELLCASQGIEYRAPLRPSPNSADAVRRVRSIVPRLDDDRPIGIDIEAIAAAIEDGAFRPRPGAHGTAERGG
ncbi:MAG: histidine ammonia-lyase [Acidimicrobiia bacterium]|nr:histidine ammonia-lyase [Acidimicrobiia bacterium]